VLALKQVQHPEMADKSKMVEDNQDNQKKYGE
jgi:hypothetical protein